MRPLPAEDRRRKDSGFPAAALPSTRRKTSKRACVGEGAALQHVSVNLFSWTGSYFAALTIISAVHSTALIHARTKVLKLSATGVVCAVDTQRRNNTRDIYFSHFSPTMLSCSIHNTQQWRRRSPLRFSQVCTGAAARRFLDPPMVKT